MTTKEKMNERTMIQQTADCVFDSLPGVQVIEMQQARNNAEREILAGLRDVALLIADLQEDQRKWREVVEGCRDER